MNQLEASAPFLMEMWRYITHLMGEQAPPTPLRALLHVTEFQFGSSVSRAVTLLYTTVKHIRFRFQLNL